MAGKSRTDWSRLQQMTDEEIGAAIARDPDAAPLLTGEWFEQSELALPGRKRPISIRLDPEVVDYFMAEGPGYQSRINAVLLQYVRYKRATAAVQAFAEKAAASAKATVKQVREKVKARA